MPYPRAIRFALAAATLTVVAAAQRPAILLTGYWPPSNEAVRQWSDDPVLNPGGWQGSDWEGRGYDVFAYFPTFNPPTCTSCGAGTGLLTVDYQDTSADFWALANARRPIAIITFSRSSTQITWELEMNQYNRTQWVNDYLPPLQPTPSPPDSGIAPDALRLSTLPVVDIVNAVNAAGLPINPYICYSGNGGGFLSEFVAYHGVWYQALHASPTDPHWCIAAGHVHVGRSLSWPLAEQAAEVTLRTLIGHLDAVRGATICQPDLGFQGPGTATLRVCGGALNVAGTTADMRLVDALPTTFGVLALGAQASPTPLLGGTIVPVPWFWAGVVTTDAQGQWFAPGLLQGQVGGSDVVAQMVYLDAAQPDGFGISNAVRLVLQ